jgi:hypothetical protein
LRYRPGKNFFVVHRLQFSMLSHGGHVVAEAAQRLWVPETLSPYATWAYSWIKPLSRSRR